MTHHTRDIPETRIAPASATVDGRGSVLSWILVLVILSLATMVYFWGAVRQANALNLSETAGGQYPYLAYARGVAEQGVGEFVGDRNRMPLVPTLFSLVYDNDWVLFLSRAKWLAIGLSLALLGVAAVVAYVILPRWPATVFTLTLMYFVYLPKASFVQAELAFYTLFLITLVLMIRALASPSLLLGVGIGVASGLAFLTKASILPCVVLFVLALIATSIASVALRARASRADGNGSVSRSALRYLAIAALSGVVFLVVVFPYIHNSKERFGYWFYNVNSTFFMWCDNWTEAQEFTERYAAETHYPGAPSAEIPSPYAYWKSHSARQMLGRLGYGLETLAALAWRGAYFKYLLVLSAIVFVWLVRSRGTQRHVRLQHWACAGFALSVFLAYLLAYAWYVPIGYGDRFIVSLFVPALLGVWWVLCTINRHASPIRWHNSRLRTYDLIALVLLPFVFGEGFYATLSRAHQPTDAFIRFYYNESLERLRHGDIAVAGRGFVGVSQLATDWAAPRRDLGMIALSSGRVVDAMRQLQRAVALDPNHADGWNSLGGAYMAGERVEEAADAFRRAVVLNEKFSAAWLNLGTALLELGETDKARNVYERLKTLSPDLAAQLAERMKMASDRR